MELDIERKRTAAPEMDDAGEKRRKVDSDFDLHHCPPSRVIHVRAVPDGSTQYDMMAAVQQFGKVSYVTLMPKVRQALIEMESVEAAMGVVDHNKANTVVVKGRPVFFNFSKSQTIKRFSEPGPSLEGQQPNHVLLFTIFNPLYPITTDVIHKICSAHGVVVRIVIFHKNGVQAMVEFPSVDDAARVKEKLDGADIYAGCCTLKIEYSKSQTLNVRINSEETWDVNLVGQEMYQPPVPMAKPPLLEHREPLVPTPPGGGGFGSPRSQQMYGDPGVGYPPRQQQPPPPRYSNPYGDYSGGSSGGGGGGGSFGNEPRVLMMYGLPGDANCQHLFNLLCQYGNVLKVKILLNKQGTAMIEMDHPQAATSALRLLHNTPLRKGRMELGYSKHSSIMSNPSPPPLHDGTPSYVDFTGSRNNRFLTEEGSSKNRVIAPTKVLHYYNAPADTTDSSIIKAFGDYLVTPPVAVKVFSRGDRGERSSTGLLEWRELEDSATAMAFVNHAELKSQSGQVFTIKLAFSPSPHAQ